MQVIVFLVICLVTGIIGGFIGKCLGDKGLSFLSGVALGVILAIMFETFIKEKL